MIKFEKVTKKFGTITALEDISFEIADNEFVFVTGHSGAGKTSLLRLVRRDYSPTDGVIYYNEKDQTKLSKKELLELRREVSVVFQDLKLLQDRTVYENVALALCVLGKKEDEIITTVSEVLELVGLSDRSTLFPAQLAGGELQREAIARAVIAKPKVILADEPTGNLDPPTAWQIVKLLKKINEMGKSVIMCTHNAEIVDSMGERVITLDKGKLVSDNKKGKYTIK